MPVEPLIAKKKRIAEMGSVDIEKISSIFKSTVSIPFMWKELNRRIADIDKRVQMKKLAIQ